MLSIFLLQVEFQLFCSKVFKFYLDLSLTIVKKEQVMIKVKRFCFVLARGTNVIFKKDKIVTIAIFKLSSQTKLLRTDKTLIKCVYYRVQNKITINKSSK